MDAVQSVAVNGRVCLRCGCETDCGCSSVAGDAICLSCIEWYSHCRVHSELPPGPLHIHGVVYHRRKLPHKVLVLALHDQSLDAAPEHATGSAAAGPVGAGCTRDAVHVVEGAGPGSGSARSVPLSFREPFMTAEDVQWTRRVVRCGDRIAVNGVMEMRPGTQQPQTYARQRAAVEQRYAGCGEKRGLVIARHDPATAVASGLGAGADAASGTAFGPGGGSGGFKPEPKSVPNWKRPIEAAATAAGDEASEQCPRRICRQWAYYNRCTNKNCTAWHPDIPVLDRRKCYAEDVRRRKLEYVQLHGVEEKGTRARVFADWLVCTFGAAFLNCGAGVLDVAGSGGDLSFHLAARHGVRSTVVDPRDPRKRTRQQSRHKKLSLPPPRVVAPQSVVPEGCMPRISALFMPPLLCGAPAQVEEHGYHSAQWALPTEDTAYADRLLSCSAVVGMHPDQATEHIVDFALVYGKAFAVVPCCVFSQEFPNRRLPSGEYVESYEQFLQYLSVKHPQTQCAMLPLQGANVVVFKRGSA